MRRVQLLKVSSGEKRLFEALGLGTRGTCLNKGLQEVREGQDRVFSPTG